MSQPLFVNLLSSVFVVLCRDDAGYNEGATDADPAPYVFATRTAFLTREEADAYAVTVAQSREPIVLCTVLDDVEEVSRRARKRLTAE